MAQNWYESNNVGVAAGYPADYAEMWRNPDSWKDTRAKMHTYMFRGISLMQIIETYGEAFLTDVICPVLANENINVAIDNPPARFTYLILLLEKGGVNVTHVGLQSVLSKPRGNEDPRFDPVLQKRIEEVAHVIGLYRKVRPNIKYGILDARPTKGWNYLSAYQRAHDLANLDFIILDCPYFYPATNRGISFGTLSIIENFVKNNLGIEYGLSITDNVGGQTSDAKFNANVIKYANQVKNTNPDYFIVMAWFPHPKLALGPHGMADTALDVFNIFTPQVSEPIVTEPIITEPVITEPIELDPVIEDYTFTLNKNDTEAVLALLKVLSEHNVSGLYANLLSQKENQ